MFRRYTDEDRQLAAALGMTGCALLRSTVLDQLAARGIAASLPDLTPGEIAAGYQGRSIDSGIESGPILELIATRQADRGHTRRVLALVELVRVGQGSVTVRLAGVIETRTPAKERETFFASCLKRHMTQNRQEV